MRRPWQVLAIVVTGVFMAGLDVFIVNIAFAQLHSDFPHASFGLLSWVLNSYTILFAAFLIVAGQASDLYGRKLFFLLGTALFTASSAACAAAPSISLLIAARALQGLGAALLLPASLGLLLPEFPPQRRHVAIGAWAAVGGVAAAAGPPLGGLLVQADWRWVFLVNLPVGLLTLVFGSRMLREIRHPQSDRPDLLGAALLSAGVAMFIAGIVKGSDWGWSSYGTMLALTLGLLMIVAVARRIATHPAPIVEPSLLRIRAFSLASAGSLVFFVAFAAMLLASVLFLTEAWHEQTLTAGLQIAPGPAMAAMWAVPGARLGQRFGPGMIGALGTLLFALGAVWWLTHVERTQHYSSAFLPGMLIGGVGVGLVIPSLTGAVAATLPPARIATGIAVQTTGRQIGSAIGFAILIAVVKNPHSVGDFADSWRFILITSILSGLLLSPIGAITPSATVDSRPSLQHDRPQPTGAAMQLDHPGGS